MNTKSRVAGVFIGLAVDEELLEHVSTFLLSFYWVRPSRPYDSVRSTSRRLMKKKKSGKMGRELFSGVLV